MSRSHAVITMGLALASAVAVAGAALAALEPEANSEITLSETKEGALVTTESFPSSEPGVLDITSGRASVSVSSWNNDEIQLVATRQVNPPQGFLGVLGGEWISRAKTRELLDSVSVEVQSDNGAIRVRTHFDELLDGNQVSLKLDLKVPRQTALRIASKEGRVLVDGVGAQVSIVATDGEVELSDIGDDVRVTTSNGRVTLERINGDVRAETENGLIQCESLRGIVDLRSSNGSIRAAQMRGGDLRCHTANGGIEIGVIRDNAWGVDLRTAQGNLDCALPVDRPYEDMGNGLRGLVRGGGSMISLSSDNGSIRVWEG